MKSRLIVVALLALSCPKGPAGVEANRAALPNPDAGVPTDQQLRRDVAQLSTDTAAWARSVEDRLWTHWTTGQPLDLSPTVAARTAVLAPARREVLVKAVAQDVERGRALNLSNFLAAEAISTALSADTDALAALEAGLTFPLDGKQVRFRDLNRLLATEKSALKRKALWAASLPAAERLDAALAERDQKLESLVAPQTAFEFFATQRDVQPEAMRRLAEAALTGTSEAWRLTLERLNQVDKALPFSALTRADLPRLMRVPAEVDLAFGKQALEQRALDTLRRLGFAGLPGLTLALADDAKKNPLPLTVTPGGPADVRTSFRPLGGLRDQQLLLSELGVALALRHVTSGHFEDERLGDSALAQASGALLATLPGEPLWLADQGVNEPVRAQILEAWEAQRLFQLRRAAASYLVRLDCVVPNDAGARDRAAAIWTRALQVTHTSADLARLRVDTDDALRSATTLRAMLLAEALRAQLRSTLGESWFREAAAGRALVELWGPGSQVPAEALVAPLSEALRAFSQHTVELTPVGQAPDGGLSAQPWPPSTAIITSRLTADGGWLPRDWKSPKVGLERPWVPRAWPTVTPRVFEDAGVDAGR